MYCCSGFNAESVRAGGLLPKLWAWISTARRSFPGEQLQAERWTPNGGCCMCPSSGSFHTTYAPSLFFCLIRNLSPALPPSSHLAGCSTDGSYGNFDGYSTFPCMEGGSRCCVISVLIFLISADNWLISRWSNATDIIWIFHQWSCICVSNSIWHMV